MIWRVALVAALLVVAFPSSADAQPEAIKRVIKRRKADLATHQAWVVMTVGFRDVLNAKIRRKLLSGLPTTIATRAYIFPEAHTKPISLSAQTCRVVFDLWDEVFRIEMMHAGKRRKTVAVNVEGVLRRCAETHRLPLSAMKALDTGKSYFVAVIVEVNPLSKEMLDKIKRWVARPKGAGAVGPGDSLFGSFVGLFITKVPASDRSMTFRTQAFTPRLLPKIKVKKKKKKKKGDKRASR